MKNQVTSIEQSRLLIGLGVPAEKASMGWFGPNYDVLCNKDAADNYTMTELGEYWQDSDYIPAFTIADLLEKVLPNVIQTKHNTYELTFSAMAGGGWRLYYNPTLDDGQSGAIMSDMGEDLITLLCSRVECLVSKGYKLEA